MAFFKGFWKNQSKHRKFGDEWELAKNQDGEFDCLPNSENAEIDTFKVKYLGRTLVSDPTSQQSTKAINTILSMAKAQRKKAQRVEVTLSMKGIEVVDVDFHKTLLEISIFRISNCSVDSTHSRVFAFLTTNIYETTECHAFLCPKKGIAEQMAITFAKAFNGVYEAWLENKHFASNFRIDDTPANVKSNHIKNGFNKQDNNQNLMSNNNMLIDISIEKCKENNWVSFENDQEESSMRIYQNMNKSTTDCLQTNLFISNSELNNRNSIDLFAF